MRGDPKNARSAKTWTSINKPFGSPVQTSVSFQPTEKGFAGNLGSQMTSFAASALDFNQGNGGTNTPVRAYKPR